MKRLTILMWFVLFLIPVSVTQSQFDNIGNRGLSERIKKKNTLFAAAPEFASTHALSPSLVVAGKEGNTKPLKLIQCGYSVRIVRFLIEVTATYEFYNPSDETVEGVFTFPLPDGATVDGYALDINGKMIDGVAVPKKRATVIFNEIERHGIDPGLIEWSGKNAFKSRIFPIDSQSSRTIRIRYTDMIDTSKYTLPIKFDGQIDKFSIEIDASKTDVLPKIIDNELNGELSELKFDIETCIAKAEYEKFQPNENLLLEFPPNNNQETVSFSTPECNYFVTRIPMDEIRRRLEPERLELEEKLAQPNRIAVYWDASGSRLHVDHTKELELLRQYLETKRCDVDLVVFRDTPEPVQSFNSESYEKLFETLKNIPYDGGTNFLSIFTHRLQPDLSLLFSDGNYNYQTNTIEDFMVLKSPFYVIGTGNSPHSPELQSITKSSGGTLFHLSRDNVSEILDGIGKISLIITFRNMPHVITQPRIGILKDSLFVAYVHQNQTSLDFQTAIHVGNEVETNKATEIITFSVAKNNNIYNNVYNDPLAERIWAQLQLHALIRYATKNRREILELGLKYNIVTPETTLLVLESLEQYIEFQVEPPASQPEMQAQYRDRKTQWNNRVQKVAKERQIKGMRILRRNWNIFTRWWNHSFELPDEYKFVPQYTDINEAFASPSNRSLRYSNWRGGGFWGMGFGGMGGAGSGMSGGNTQTPSPTVTPNIVLQPRIADSPYLEIIRNAAASQKQSPYAVYLEQRKQYQNSPFFYWESAILFHELGDMKTALRILSNLQELEFGDDLVTLQMLGFLTLQWNQTDLAILLFHEALGLKENDPISLRGLALTFLLQENPDREDHFVQSFEAFHKLIKTVWDHYDYNNNYDTLCLISLYELQRMAIKGNRRGFRTPDNNQNIHQNVTKPLDVDLRIVASASHPNVRVCLAVTEPSGEFVRQDNRCLSVHGGALITNNQNLSQYLIRKAEKGTYKIVLERFDVKENDKDEWDELEDQWEDLKDFVHWNPNDLDEEEPQSDNNEKEKADALAPGVVFVDIFTNYGRDNETRRSLCIILDDVTERYEIGEVNF
jgi:hypothetical protein